MILFLLYSSVFAGDSAEVTNNSAIEQQRPKPACLANLKPGKGLRFVVTKKTNIYGTEYKPKALVDVYDVNNGKIVVQVHGKVVNGKQSDEELKNYDGFTEPVESFDCKNLKETKMVGS